jgi:arylsulfatase A-like enzyme
MNALLRVAAVVLALSAIPSLRAAENRQSDKPNIVILFADDLGYADLGCQGSQEVKSPYIDSIADNGVRFTSGYVTAPQCCPSRAGLLPGRYQNRFGFEDNNSNKAIGGLPLGEKTIADYLRAAGYMTGMVGKWHLGSAEPYHPYQRGFDETLWHPNGGILFPDKETGFLRGLMRGPDPVEIAEYSTDAFGREACEFIDRHQRDPFFLYVSFVPPHWPMQAKPEHTRRGTSASTIRSIGREAGPLASPFQHLRRGERDAACPARALPVESSPRTTPRSRGTTVRAVPAQAPGQRRSSGSG